MPRNPNGVNVAVEEAPQILNRVEKSRDTPPCPPDEVYIKCERLVALL